MRHVNDLVAAIDRPALLEKLAGRRVVASVSGGKDSAAMSLLLTELGIEHERVFMDTGWEHPATYDYLRGELARALGPITEIRGVLGLADLCRKKGTFPSRIRRFCTSELKVLPMQRHLVGCGVEVVNAVGIRAGESDARSKLSEWEWSEAFDCETWRPLIHWTESDVIEMHKRHGLAPNPLYLKGASRVGCWPCIFSRKAEIAFLAEHGADRVDELRALEAELSQRAGAKRTWFHSSSEAQNAFGERADEAHKYAVLNIDEAIAWSRTSRGGRQFEMFAASGREAGCVRWGLCDVGGNQ